MANTTFRMNREFTRSIIDDDLLEKSIDWIGDNLNPNDVFTFEILEEWALENGYKKVEEE